MPTISATTSDSQSRGVTSSVMLGLSQLALRWASTGERPTTAFDRTPGPMRDPYRRACSGRRTSHSRSQGDRMTDQYFNAPLAEVDPEIAQVLERELERQRGYLEMIASENFVPVSILQSQGSVLTNKYAEGYPGRRYYGGCEEVDVAEELAIARAKSLFGSAFANVQPHSGATANAAVLHAIARPGDTLLGLSLDQGGHLTHGMKINFSGRLYNIVAYGVDPETSVIDMDEVARLAREHQPKVIIAGWSAYPRQLDFAKFREIADEVGALLWVDMAHFAGLVAAGLHPSPVPHAHVVSSTVHKTIGGPRSGYRSSCARSTRRRGRAGRATGAGRRRRGPRSEPCRPRAARRPRRRSRGTSRSRADAGRPTSRR